MAMAEWLVEAPRPTFSFYLTAARCNRDPQIAAAAADLAGAITVAGPGGPEIVRKLRDLGLDCSVLFDGMGYADMDLPARDGWVGAQRAIGAVCPLLPGAFLAWDRSDNIEFIGTVQEQSRIAAGLEATMLFAIDARWIARKAEVVIDTLMSANQPVALVFAHRGDPLSEPGAVQGLRRVAQRVNRVSLLRSDHGAIGALAFGARHASVGLTTSTRHYAPPVKGAWRRPGQSARLFVRPLLDWFLASGVAGWTAAGEAIVCNLPCCHGQSLARFLDADLDADWHNMNALADLADYVINAPKSDRASEFLGQCRIATKWYDRAGFNGPEKPKAQLTGWVLS